MTWLLSRNFSLRSSTSLMRVSTSSLSSSLALSPAAENFSFAVASFSLISSSCFACASRDPLGHSESASCTRPACSAFIASSSAACSSASADAAASTSFLVSSPSSSLAFASCSSAPLAAAVIVCSASFLSATGVSDLDCPSEPLLTFERDFLSLTFGFGGALGRPVDTDLVVDVERLACVVLRRAAAAVADGDGDRGGRRLVEAERELLCGWTRVRRCVSGLCGAVVGRTQ